MKKALFVALSAGLLAVSANAQARITAAPKNSDGCFEISTAEQLLYFSQHINNSINNPEAFGEDGQDHKTDCAILMNDIKFNGETQVVNNTMTGLAVSDVTILNAWEPLIEFAGSFDGQGHTVYGLYYTNATDAGFFASLSGDAVVKNLHIRDSYFAADERAGGVIADVKSGAKIDLDQISFGGVVTIVSTCKTALGKVNGHLGGLIGTVSKGAEIINLSNSYNLGSVITGNCSVYDNKLGGLVGTVQDSESGKSLEMNITNCYNAGTVDQNGLGSDPSVFGSVASGAKITTTEVGCTKKQNTYCPTATTEEDLKANYESRIEAQIQAALNNAENPAEGIDVSKDDKSGKRIAFLRLSADEEKVVIPQDVLVDSIVLDRSFSTNRSTITLPFSISADKVFDAAGEPVKFYNLETMVVTDDSKWEVQATEVSVGAINAHTPYLVQAKTAGAFSFVGSVTLKAANGVAKSTDIAYGETPWSFVGVYTKKHWDDDERAQEGCDECGRSFLFSNNKFVKVGKNVNALPYRAYLMAPVPFKPTVLAKVAASTSVSLAENPSEITVRDLGTDADKFDVVEVVFQKAEPMVVNEIVESIEGSEESQAIKAPVMLQKRSSNKWNDIKGRSMNRKPTAKGAYIHNEIPVVVK